MKKKEIKKLTYKVLDNLNGSQLLKIKKAIESGTIKLNKTRNCIFGVTFDSSRSLAARGFKYQLGLIDDSENQTCCKLEHEWYENETFTLDVIKKYFKKFKIRD